MANRSTGFDFCSECGEEIRGEVCPKCSIGRVVSTRVDDEGKIGIEAAKSRRLPLVVAGTEVVAGISYAVLAMWALIQHSSDFVSVSIVLSFSIFLILSGVLLWRSHKVGWVLSLIIQVISIPHIDLQNFSWTIETPIHFFIKFRRGNHYFGVDLLALFFAIVLYTIWQRHRNAPASEVESVSAMKLQ